MNEIETRLRRGPVAAPTVPDEVTQRFRRAAERAGLVDVGWSTVDSPVGELTVAATEAGVVALTWDRDELLDRLAAAISPRVLESRRRLDPARRQLDEYFAHRRRRFELPIDWTLVHGFRQDVLRELAQVPYGDVVSYGELAERVGNPKASRAVGSAMATNPMAIIVPCHRVVRAGGALGNYSGRGGVVTKQWLLDFESAE